MAPIRRHFVPIDLDTTLGPGHYHPRTPADVRAILRAVRDLPAADLMLLSELAKVLKQKHPNDPIEYQWRLGGSPFYISMGQPFPADLDEPASSPQARKHLQALAVALVWLMAIIVPIVQQRLSAEGQIITDAEVGTLSFALAITALLKQAKK
jgi:hypothetical protein